MNTRTLIKEERDEFWKHVREYLTQERVDKLNRLLKFRHGEIVEPTMENIIEYPFKSSIRKIK